MTIAAFEGSTSRLAGSLIVQLLYIIVMIIIKPFTSKAKFFVNLLSEFLIAMAVVCLFLAVQSENEDFNVLFILFFFTSILLNFIFAFVTWWQGRKNTASTSKVEAFKGYNVKTGADQSYRSERAPLTEKDEAGPNHGGSPSKQNTIENSNNEKVAPTDKKNPQGDGWNV